MTKVNFNIKLTKKQQEAYKILHDKYTQFLIARWSRQCGKTVLAEIMLMEYLFKKNTFNAYISPSFQLGRKVYAEITKMLEGKGVIKKANSTTLTIETVYGSTLQFFSIEAYTSIRGTTISGILVLDECGYYPDLLPNGEEPWGNVIFPIIKSRKPRVLCISTPHGKRGMLWDLYLRAQNGEEGYKAITATIYDDSLVTPQEIETIKKSISDIAFRQEFMVEFLDSALTFFTGFEDCFSEFTYDDRLKTFVGVDLSSTGADNTVVTLINELNQVKQYVVEGTLDMKYTRIANIINSVPNLVGAYLENNGVGSPMINQIRKLVTSKSKLHEWTTTNSSKEEIISDLAVTIANKEIQFNKEDGGLFSELGTFIVKYTKTGKMQFEAQSGKKDDRILSLAMALKAKNDFKYSGKNNNAFVMTNNKLYI